PDRQNLEAEIIEKYIVDKLSTSEIGTLYGFNAENISKILRKNNVKLRPQFYINVKRFSTKQNYSPEELEYLLIKKYKYEKKTIAEIRKETGLDENCISNKLRSYGIEVKPSRNKTGVFKKCLWCSKEFNAWITNGPRTQNYCSRSCNCKAKDFRAQK